MYCCLISYLVWQGLPLLGAVVGLHLGGFVLGYTVPLLLGYKRSVASTVASEMRITATFRA